MIKTVKVLDKGYVKLIDSLGNDLSVINAARASYQKSSSKFTTDELKLLTFLVKHGHTSPFRHVFFTFEVKAPLMVARQWWKHVVGSDHTMEGWNEASRRYVTSKPEFYNPENWRRAVRKKKQGSGKPINNTFATDLDFCLQEIIARGLTYYNRALEAGVSPEMARLFLPAYGLYVTWRWSTSLQAVVNFLDQRLQKDAQWEIREYSVAVKQLARVVCPYTFETFFKD
jgi:thymidylate synthase (FAD)